VNGIKQSSSESSAANLEKWLEEKHSVS